MSQDPIQGSGVPKLTNEFLYEQIKPFTIPLGTDEANAIEVFKISFKPKAGVIKKPTNYFGFSAVGESRRDAGAGLIRCQLEQSDDDISYFNAFTMGSGATSLTSQNMRDNGNNYPNDRQFLRIILFATDLTTAGIWQNLYLYINLKFPVGYTVEKLI